jgi:hypothetical protein
MSFQEAPVYNTARILLIMCRTILTEKTCITTNSSVIAREIVVSNRYRIIQCRSCFFGIFNIRRLDLTYFVCYGDLDYLYVSSGDVDYFVCIYHFLCVSFLNYHLSCVISLSFHLGLSLVFISDYQITWYLLTLQRFSISEIHFLSQSGLELLIPSRIINLRREAACMI